MSSLSAYLSDSLNEKLSELETPNQVTGLCNAKIYGNTKINGLNHRKKNIFSQYVAF